MLILGSSLGCLLRNLGSFNIVSLSVIKATAESLKHPQSNADYKPGAVYLGIVGS